MSIQDRLQREMFTFRLPLSRFFHLVGALAWLPAAAHPQAVQGSLFTSVRPQILVQVEEHETGAELVQISPIEPDYPEDLLRRQVRDLGARLGNSLRAERIDRDQVEGHSPMGDPRSGRTMTFLKAFFAVDGLADLRKGEVNLTPLVQAFAGAPAPHTVKGMSVIVSGLTPGTTTLKKFSDGAVEVEGRFESSPPSVEYRVLLKSQQPDAINIRLGGSAPPAPPKPKPGISPALVWALVSAGGLAAGVLVYFLVLRRLAGPTS